MSYHQPYGQQPPYRAPPQGHSPYSPQAYPQGPPQGYPPQQACGQAPPQGYLPHNSYQQPAPPNYSPQGACGQPQSGGYSAPLPEQQPLQQYGYGAPHQYPSQQYGALQQYGAPPQKFHPQPAYGASQPYVQPTPPSLGYANPPPHVNWSGDENADALRKAMKGFGTDEKALIRVLANKDPLQINVIQQSYNYHFSRNLEADVKSEVSGWFKEGLCAILRGPLNNDVYLLRTATDGPDTKKKILNDVLLGRSNADMRIIKELYQNTWGTSLENVIKSDLSMKTKHHFLIVLAANRNEEAVQIVPQQIEQDVMDIYRATEGKVGTDELLVCSILSQRSDAQIRAIAHTYQQKFSRDLETVIKKEFSGHMELALLHQLRTGTDKTMRDALLLEDAMSGVGTKDSLLVQRVVRIHWDRNHMQQVKGAYQHRFRKSLTQRVRGETSGDYEKLMCACIGE